MSGKKEATTISIYRMEIVSNSIKLLVFCTNMTVFQDRDD